MSIEAHHVVARGAVLWRATLDGVLVRVPGADEVVALEGTGGAVWAALDQPVPFAELCRRLAVGHDATAEEIATDLHPVLEDLADRSVVRVDG